MAHFAEIDSNSLVLRVVVVSNADTALADGKETESIGIAHCQKLFGGTWVQTSYNGNFRKNYAGVGSTYDSTRNAFYSPKPFNSWVLNESTCVWEAPVALPSDSGEGDPPKMYRWDEDSTSWVVEE
jgi:hypothetical protein|tara:strand:- start:206 stop:583 length:378 start_codon:yes stop_codon:yes gene_type:complete